MSGVFYYFQLFFKVNSWVFLHDRVATLFCNVSMLVMSDTHKAEVGPDP